MYSKILKANVGQFWDGQFLENTGSGIPNLRKKGFENFKKICMYLFQNSGENFRKFQKYFKT